MFIPPHSSLWMEPQPQPTPWQQPGGPEQTQTPAPDHRHREERVNMCPREQLSLWSLATQFSSVQSLSRVWFFATPWTAAHQASLSIINSWSLLKLMSFESVMPSNHLILCRPLSSCLPSSQHLGLFQWVGSLHQVAKVFKFQLQHQSFQWTPRTDILSDALVGSPYSPRDSQESSPTPRFKSINSSVLSFLYGPTLTSIHDYWKNHSLN